MIKKIQKVNVTQIIPSIITLLSISSSITSILYSINNIFGKAIFYIILSIFLDMADGKIARIFNVETKFGCILDALADSNNFGLSTSMLFLFWLLDSKGINIIIIFYILCIMSRLARFVYYNNNKYFIGLPSAVSSGVIILIIFSSLEHISYLFFINNSRIILVLIFSMSILLLCKIKFFYIKSNNNIINIVNFIYKLFYIALFTIYQQNLFLLILCIFHTFYIAIISFIKLK